MYMNILNDTNDAEVSDNRTKKVTINVTEDEFALYELLRDEYGLKMNKEMWKAMSPRILQLRDRYIKAKAS